MTDKLHSINDDVNNLDDHIALLVGKSAVPPVDLEAWKKTASEWRQFFATEADRSILGNLVSGPSDTELETWNSRLDNWRAKAVIWDNASKNVTPVASVAAIVEKHLPEASVETQARVETRIEEIKQAAQLAKSQEAWKQFVWVGSGILGVAAVGYLLSGVARVTGK